jgi:signal transduction histidine kinase
VRRGTAIHSQIVWRIALIYALLAGAYIFLSDRLLVALVHDPRLLAQLETLKGWAFVLVTSLGLYFLLRRALTLLIQAQQRLEGQIEERTQELSALLELSHHLTSTLELKSLLNLILDEVKPLVDYDTAGITERRQGDEFVILGDRWPTGEAGPIGARFHPAPGPIWQILVERRQPLILPDMAADTPEAQAYRDFLATQRPELLSGLSSGSFILAPLTVKERMIGTLSVHHPEPNHYTHHHVELVLAIASQAAVAMENARLYEQAQESAVLEERQRVARDLHDSVTQALYSVILYADAAHIALSAGRADTATDHLRELREMAQQVLREMRLLIFELRPQELDQRGLAAAIRSRLDMVEARVGMETELQTVGEGPLPVAVEQELYRIAQEALNNVVKHSHAQRVKVQLCLMDGKASLEVADDGVGFDPHLAQEQGGLGLQSMEERVRRCDGRLAISSAPGEGTRVRVEVSHV